VRASFLIGFLATILWGLGTTYIKWLLFLMPPCALLLVQVLASCAFLWIPILLWDRPKMTVASMVKYSLPGLLQPGTAFILGIWGLALSTASSDAVIWASESIVTLFLAWLVLREKMTTTLIVLSLTAFGGTVLATVPFTAGQEPCPTCLAGNLILVTAMSVGAAYTVFTRRQMEHVSSLHLLALHQVAALVLIIPCWLVEVFLHLGPAYRLDPGLLAAACLSGISQYALAFLLFFRALRSVGAARACLLFSLPPIFTLISSYLFLNERLTLLQWVGAFVALSTVFAVSWLSTPAEISKVEPAME
jgi:drug/metabolite transporter (DMT)-like permease